MELQNKRLLILGATSETEKLVKTAEDMGVITYVVDPNINAPAKKYSSNPVELDCFDEDSICNLVKKEKIDGILPGCADILVGEYERICGKLGFFCYVNKETVKVFNNKKNMKESLIDVGLNCIKEYKYEEINDSFNNYPLFIKPVDNNSSKGMSVVYSRDKFEYAYKKALSFSRSNTVLIEDYLTCDDFFVGYLLQNNELKVTFTGDRYVIRQEGYGSITSAIVYPSKYNDLYFKTAHKKIEKICKESRFVNGILAIQGFVKDNNILFYDPALRITGGQEYVLLKKINKFDELACLINFALYGKLTNDGSDIMTDCSFEGKVACNLAVSSKACKIGRIEGIDFLEKDKRIVNLTQEHFEGDVIDKVGTAQQNIMRMHILVNNINELIETIGEIKKKVRIYNDEGIDKTLDDPFLLDKIKGGNHQWN